MPLYVFRLRCLLLPTVHFIGESDSLTDRLHGLHLPPDIRRDIDQRQQAAVTGKDFKFTTEETDGSPSPSPQSGVYSLEGRLGSSTNPPAGVFIRGSRSCFRMAPAERQWWHDRFRPTGWREIESRKAMSTILEMDKVKAPTIKEPCEECGHDTAYYHTFQARSADEGMTIMFECVECHARRVYNS
eukprot:GHVN01060188.1.p1 GENE.GHVN01060188.1~~GHVN01060188.1.p1  ORF type:complete len:186 (-),score=33.00 GHVN01060188.1:1047-1604(-)